MQPIQDDANAWFLSQGQDIQDFEAPEAPDFTPDGQILDPDTLTDPDLPDPSRPYADLPDVTASDRRNVENLRAIAQPTAEVIVGTIDVIIPLLITLLIRGSERDDTRLSADERDTLVEAWATYLGDKNIALSPTTSLIIAMVTIYGSKIIAALTARRERRQLEMLRRRIESQQQQIATQQQTIVALQREVQDAQKNNQ